MISPSGAEANLGDMKDPNAANDPNDANSSGKQLESSEPGEASGPPAEPAAHTSLPAEDAAAGDAAADALPTSTELKAARKNKKKQKRQQKSDNLAASCQLPPDNQSQRPVKPTKKKHQSGKVWPSSSVPGSLLPLDDTPTLGDAELLALPAHMLQLTAKSLAIWARQLQPPNVAADSPKQPFGKPLV